MIFLCPLVRVWLEPENDVLLEVHSTQFVGVILAEMELATRRLCVLGGLETNRKAMDRLVG
jgi:hypothetical protein